MACMILVENPGSWTIYGPLRHARWGYLNDQGIPVHETITPTDLIMPFFLFIIGVSVVFALWDKRDAPTTHQPALSHVALRTGKLFALGIVFYAYPSVLGSILYGDDVSIQVVGVLQRIAVVYFVSAIFFLKGSSKTILWAAIATLVVYWGLTFIPVPGYPDPQFIRQYNTPGNIPSCFPEWVDAKIIGFARPEGLLSTFPAMVSGLIGVLTGMLIKNEKDPHTLVRRMAIYGVALLIVGYSWSFAFPIIKDLWTSSYTLVAGGYSLLAFAAIYWLTDVKKMKAWTPPFIAYGVNCISVYFVSHIVASTLHVIRVGAEEDTISLHEWININAFQSWLSPVNASLVFALLVVAFWLIPLWIMYWKEIFIKV